MKRLTVLLVLVVLAVGLTAGEAGAAAPGNDNFADATELTSLPASVSQSTVGATIQTPDEPKSSCSGSISMGPTVWFRYTPSVNINLMADTVGSDVDFDTVLSVYTGSTLASLSEVACNDDNMDVGSLVAFPAIAGTTYWFQVGGYDSADSGDLVFNLYAFSPAPNDAFASAMWLASVPTSLSYATVWATLEGGEPMPPCRSDFGASVWFAFTPVADVHLVADTFGSNFDTVLGVYTGDTLASLSAVACRDDAYPLGTTGRESRVEFDASGLTTYWFQVGGYAETGGVLVFNLTGPPTQGVLPPEDGFIVVEKVVSGGAPAASFSFHGSWGAGFSLAGGGSAASGPIAPGVYSVAEVVPTGWTLASAVCSDGSSPAAIGVSPGETVTCTFTNVWPTCLGLPATIVGTAGADILTGTPGADVIVGLGGDDVIRGLGGNDRICGGGGDDVLYGGVGNDRVRGGAGDDSLIGRRGDDRLRGGAGVDEANGGLGRDFCRAEVTAACE